MAVRANYTGTTAPTPTNWTAGDALAHATAINTFETQLAVQSTVRYVAVPTGVPATDTAAIQTAHDSLPANGGILQLARGDYSLTNPGPTFTKQVTLLGQGAARPNNQACTSLVSNSATATGITCNAEGCYLDRFGIVNNFSGTVTAGIGIRMQKAHQALIGPDVNVWGFFDNIAVESGHYWQTFAQNYSPWRYGLIINNSDNADSGDNVVGGWFDMPGVTRNATAAIRWQTGGGFRFTGKINASGSNKFGIGIDFAYTGGTDTADLFITPGSSIENCSSIGVRAARASGSNKVILVQILGLEMMNIPTGIQIGAGFEDVLIDHINAWGMTTGVDLTASATRVTVGSANRWRAVTTPVNIAAGATEIRVHEQLRCQPVDGIVVTDATSTGLGGTTIVNYDYTRNIDFTVTSTPQPLFSVGVTNFYAGTIEVEVDGVHSGVGGFVARRIVAYVVNGSGVVAVTPMETVSHGSTGPQISFTTTTNGIVARIATTDNASVAGGRAYFKARGHLSQLRIGA